MIMGWSAMVRAIDSNAGSILTNGIRPQGWPWEESRGSGRISTLRYPDAGRTRLYKLEKALGNFVADWSKKFWLHTFQESAGVSLSHS